MKALMSPTPVASLLLLLLLVAGRAAGLAAAPSRRRVYKHLYRHYDDISFDSWLRCADPAEFLNSIGYTDEEIGRLQADYPKILDQNVHGQLAPKVRFLVETCQGGEGVLDWASEEAALHAFDPHQDDEEPCLLGEELQSPHTLRLFPNTKAVVPGSFYQCQLDRSVGPKHAYLVHHDIHPNSAELLQSSDNFAYFLEACKSKDKFVVLCNAWDGSNSNKRKKMHTADTLDSFEKDFCPGLVPAAQGRSRVPIGLLLRHGANHLEPDPRGVLPLHWAAGAGDADGMEALMRAHCTAYEHDLPDDDGDRCARVVLSERGAKDGATPLHWACCGVRPGEVGGGGSFDVCRLLLEKSGARGSELANAETYSRSTPLHWAAWAGNTEIVDLLVNHGADPHAVNNRGTNAVHYAAASGQLAMCQQLNGLGVDLKLQDESEQTPMDYAKSFDRPDVVEWLAANEQSQARSVSEHSPQRA